MARQKSQLSQWVEDNINKSLTIQPNISLLNDLGNDEWNGIDDKKKYSSVYTALKKVGGKTSSREPREKKEVRVKVFDTNTDLASILDPLFVGYSGLYHRIDVMHTDGEIGVDTFNLSAVVFDKMEELLKVLSGKQDGPVTGAYKPVTEDR